MRINKFKESRGIICVNRVSGNICIICLFNCKLNMKINDFKESRGINCVNRVSGNIFIVCLCNCKLYIIDSLWT